MASISQNDRGKKRTTTQICLQRFTDHAGNRALRYGYRNNFSVEPAPWPPTDYAATPWFCLQVYLSVDMNLDEDGEGDECIELRAINDGRAHPTVLKCAKLTRHLFPRCDWDQETPQPLWEIYTIPGGSALDLVEHSRREILHRKNLRLSNNVQIPLIPLIRARSNEERKSAFLFVVDNYSRLHDAKNIKGSDKHVLKWPFKTGLLWVHFDPRLPSSVTTANRDWQVPYYKRCTNDVEFYTEQQDVKIKRIQDREGSHYGIQSNYSSSWKHEPARGPYSEDKNDGMDFGDELNDVLSTSQVHELMSKLDIDDTQAKLDTRHIIAEKGENWIRLYNHRPDTPPDARYAIYVPFSFDDGQILDPIARAFTASFLSLQQGDSTVDLHFYRPPEPTDASILTHFASLGLPQDFIGTLTTLQASRSFSNPIASTQPQEIAPRRLFPLSTEPEIFKNDPDSFRQEPYKSFSIIVDRPDFETSAAIRFLLADGGSSRGNDRMQASDYCETEVWRVEDMRNLVRRLMMVQP
jgi:hypothetical protein